MFRVNLHAFHTWGKILRTKHSLRVTCLRLNCRFWIGTCRGYCFGFFLVFFFFDFSIHLFPFPVRDVSVIGTDGFSAGVGGGGWSDKINRRPFSSVSGDNVGAAMGGKGAPAQFGPVVFPEKCIGEGEEG